MRRTFVPDPETVMEHKMSDSPLMPNAWGPGQHDLVEEAKSLVPLLRSCAVETEELGRLPRRSAEALRRAGFFSMFAPRRFGGHETSPHAAAEVLAELGRGDGSTAWVAAMLSATAYLVSLLGEEGRRDV
jgi:3-hydroxy-9,10-secoandrosta-1,3,5(10)-triene-9,17-dione monooxygenase